MKCKIIYTYLNTVENKSNVKFILKLCGMCLVTNYLKTIKVRTYNSHLLEKLLLVNSWKPFINVANIYTIICVNIYKIISVLYFHDVYLRK